MLWARREEGPVAHEASAVSKVGSSQSLRQLSQRWSAVVGGSVGLRTINERINQIEPLLRQAHRGSISDVAPVVQFDGIWLRVQIPTETEKRDKRGRKRQGRKGKKAVLLVATSASGPMAAGRSWTLKWLMARAKRPGNSSCIGCGNEACGWRRGYKRWEADGSGELGEALAWVYGASLLEQRCIFHKLRNVADKCREERKAARTTKKRGLNCLSRPRLSTKLRVREARPNALGDLCRRLASTHAPSRWPPSNGILSRRLRTQPSKASHAN